MPNRTVFDERGITSWSKLLGPAPREHGNTSDVVLGGCHHYGFFNDFRKRKAGKRTARERTAGSFKHATTKDQSDALGRS